MKTLLLLVAVALQIDSQPAPPRPESLPKPAANPSASQPARPNIVLIVADDLGYGDLGCYGSRQNHTPQIDRLAAEGIRFTDFHSNGPMCSATRTALLTGFYQNRFGRSFEGALGPAHAGLPLDAMTLSELLQHVRYATAIYGKWHLGNSAPFLPTRQGFGEFRGLLTGDGDHHTHISRSGQPDWYNGETIELQPGYTADLLTRYSIDFIERHQNTPFFLYVPHLAIHFPWQGPDDPPHRQEGVNYADDKWGIIPDRSNVAPHVKAMVEALDRSVGAIIGTLKRLDLDRNTLVLFTSDNGGYINYAGGFENISSNGPLRGQKTELYEGGHRVPAIAWWPARLRPRVCNEIVLTFDIMPTVLRLASAPPHPGDGVDLTGLLFRGEPLPQRRLFWRRRDSKAVREGPWKLMIPGANRPPELYHLADDIGESRDLAAQQPDRIARMSSALKAWEEEMAQSTRPNFPDLPKQSH